MSDQTPGQSGQTKPEWYAKGLRFECTQCGNCCTGGPGYVAFTEDEGKAIAKVLGISHERFLKDYTKREGGGRSLKENKTHRGYDCVFLDFDEQGLAICKVYQARPLQCRTFPWWPENLRSEANWKRLARGCEGIGRGNFVPIEHIRVERDRQAADAGLDIDGPFR